MSEVLLLKAYQSDLEVELINIDFYIKEATNGLKKVSELSQLIKGELNKNGTRL